MCSFGAQGWSSSAIQIYLLSKLPVKPSLAPPGCTISLGSPDQSVTLTLPSFLPSLLLHTASFLPFGGKRWNFLVSPASKIETVNLENAQADPIVHFSVLCMTFFGLLLNWLCHIHQQIMCS